MAKQTDSSTDRNAGSPKPQVPSGNLLDGKESAESMLVSGTHLNKLDESGIEIGNRRDVPALDINALIDQFHQGVYRYAFRLSGNRSDAEDLAQQVFLIAHRKLDQLKDQSKAGGWLMTITRSCFLKSIRRRRPMNETTLQMSVDQIPRESIDSESIDRMVLQDALLELPEDYRVVVLMFYFEHLSYKEIADQLGVKIGTVMSRLSRAKGTLREMLIGTSTEK